MTTNYKLIILFGKAGAGKDFLLRKVYEKRPDDINLIISDTTRPPRMSEKDGINYNFVTEEEFLARPHIETAYFNNWRYGTPYSSLDPKKVNLGVMNPEGIRQVYSQENLDIHLFYISAPDKERLLRQLTREEYPDVSEVCRRFLADEKDFCNLYRYPYRKLRNSVEFDINECVETILNTVEELKADLDRIK